MVRFVIQTLRWLLLRNFLTYQIDPPWRKRPNLARSVQRRDYAIFGGEKMPKTKKETMVEGLDYEVDQATGTKLFYGSTYAQFPGFTGKAPDKGKVLREIEAKQNRLQEKYPPHQGELKDESLPVPELAKSIVEIAEGMTGRKIYFILNMYPRISGDIYISIAGTHKPGSYVKVCVAEGYFNSSDEARTVLIVKALKELLDAEQEYTSKDKLGRLIVDNARSGSGWNLSTSFRASNASATYVIPGWSPYSNLLSFDAGLRHKLAEVWLDGEDSGAGSVRSDRDPQARLAKSSLEEESPETASQDRLL
jgi:hypothetical protein